MALDAGTPGPRSALDGPLRNPDPDRLARLARRRARRRYAPRTRVASAGRRTLRIPRDVEDRLGAVAEAYGIGVFQLAVSILCEWVGQNAPYRVRPPGLVPWWDRHDHYKRKASATRVAMRPDDSKPIEETGPRSHQSGGPCYEIRVRRGFTLARLALYAGVSEATVQRIERGGAPLRRVTLGQLVKVGDALGVAATDLVPGLALAPRAWRRGTRAKVPHGENPLDCGALVAERDA